VWLAVAVYVAGVIVRYLYIFTLHPATSYVFSDMGAYYLLGTNFFNHQYQPTLLDTFYPPGMTYFLGVLYHLDPSWKLTFAAQWLISSLVPLVVFAIARALYGRRAALVALVMASAYFPFIDYAGYFLSENPFTLSLLLWMWLLIKGRTSPSRAAAVAFALASGVLLGVAVAFKNVALGPGLLVLATLVCVDRRRALPVVAASAVGLLAVLAPLTVRATALSGGRFTFIANNLGANVLVGHHGRIKAIVFAPDEFGRAFFLSPPAQEMRGYEEIIQVPFGVLETSKALAFSFEWVRAHASEALLLSLQHVWDLFGGVLPWPSGKTDLQGWAQLFRVLFWPVLVVPAGLHVFRRARAARLRRGLLAADLLMLMPLLGIAAIAFLTMGEPRYRTPFDGFLIVLAAAFFAGPSTETGASESENGT
jgi:4-amino-4-deoxy-L-arabinose transferase-like glycosyltransferase